VRPDADGVWRLDGDAVVAERVPPTSASSRQSRSHETRPKSPQRAMCTPEAWSAGEPCVVTAWPGGEDGRKVYAGTTLFAGDGELLARARQVWIAPR